MTTVHKNALGLAGMCLGTALIVMEANVVNVAVPAIRSDFRAGAATALWAVDAYTLVFAALLLSAGLLGDRIGARRAYLIGLVIFAVASLVAGLAPSAGVLISARAAQGVGAALLAPAPLTLITRTYTDPAAWAKAVAVWVSVGGIGFMVGPLLSGALVDTAGWRSVFLLNLPVVALTCWLLLGYVPETTRRRTGFDPRGQVLAAAGLAAVVSGLVESTLDGWVSWPVLGPLVGGAAVLVIFVVSQHRGARAGRQVLLPPSILAARPVLAGLLAGAAYNFTLYGTLIVYTFDFQELRHLSPLATGAAFLPLTVVATITSALVGGRVTHRYGPRAGIGVGMLCCAAGLAILAFGTTSVPYAAIAVGLAVFAFGQNLVAPAQALVVMSFAPDEHRNMGSSALNTARQTGGAVGVALLGAIAAGHRTSGTPIAMCLAIAVCLLAATAAVKLIPGPRSMA
ncbi:MFS transporter [Actinocrispum wychmicini]|uniref:DHA2 family methylenomycin A resistance protein-like MFS transporter n=1 Tax=Actinocrispum wychmicini TaxID=1213861 RepID=A0A4V2S618_9PSEU|nr:MFS transporter [Actinocrispum wychmicini]TCO54340.1 DHA2 family methylenomycin A resistance protein-like MFS transporter [Actinocrispum wychmicini]